MMSESKAEHDSRLMLECLFMLGEVEKERGNYTSAITAFETFQTYLTQHTITVEADTTEYIENAIVDLKKIIQVKFKGGGDGKNVPYQSSDTKTSTKPRGSKARQYKKLKDVSKEEQRETVSELWAKMEANKMDIEEGSKWYIISMNWFSQWKAWSGFVKPSSRSEDESTKDENFKSESTDSDNVSEPKRIDNYDILNSKELMLFGECNLEDNLNEDVDFVIVTPEIWRYLYSIYDGTPILRKGIKNIDENSKEEVDCIIEVNQVKLYIFEVPREHDQDYYEVMLSSRNETLDEIKYRI